MRNISQWVLALACIVVLVSCDKMNKKPSLDSEKSKGSYAIGQQIGRGMKAQNVDIDVDVLAMSIKDVLESKPSQLTDEEMQTAILAMNQKVQAEQEAKGKENIEKGKTYLDANKKKEGVKTTKSGLQYKVLQEGKGKSPKATSKVKVHYKGTLIDGSEFDSSYKRNQPAEFPVNGVIPGWTEALQLMKPGAKYELVIPSELAYGAQGRPGIPPHSVLVFEVELLEVK